MKAQGRSVETLGLWIVTSSVTFIKSLNPSSIKLCLIVHLVTMWTLLYNIVNSEFRFFTTTVNKIVQANNEVNCTWVLKYHKCFQLWITAKWPRSYTLSLNITIIFMYLRLLGHPRYCVGKWKFKHSDRRLKSLSKNNTLPFYTWKVFEKFRLHELKNVSYSKLKLNTFSPLELFAELSQFLSGANKVSNKITAVEWITAFSQNRIPTWPSWSSLNYFLFTCLMSLKERKELGL